jgi:hypothetical protein
VAQHPDLAFSKDFFVYHIDKFFSKELDVVLQSIDDEYDKYLKQTSKAEDEFQRQMEDLDDYFLAGDTHAVTSP